VAEEADRNLSERSFLEDSYTPEQIAQEKLKMSMAAEVPWTGMGIEFKSSAFSSSRAQKYRHME
jgi:hypothetical protein